MSRQMTPLELNQLGDQYFYGRGQNKNIELAFTYYKQAADMNNPIGLFNIGKYYQAKSEAKRAFQYFKKSAELDYSESYIMLYTMYLEGIGVRKSKKKAFAYLKLAASKQMLSSFHLLGHMYENGIGTKASETKAEKYYELSASKNNLNGMHALALYYLKGITKTKNIETAFYWLDKAAQMHHRDSVLELIRLYQKPHPSLNKHSLLYLEEMTFHYQEILAKMKDIENLKLVAKAYIEGRTFLTENYNKAYQYYRILHELDEVEGYFGLGYLYLYGLGIEKDYALAKDYLEIASSRNDSRAKNLLGDIYRNGLGVKTDYHLAKENYLGAAEKDDIDALINLSLLHYRKQIHHASPSQALTFIERAITQEHPKAYFWLGLYNELGVGKDKNLEESITAYKRGVQLGNNASRYKLANILYRDIKKTPQSKRKTDSVLHEVKELLMTYIEGVDTDNRLKAMYLLGELYKEPQFTSASDKISRYYFEVAAENGYSKAMNRLYEIFKDDQEEIALNWLLRACEKPQDGEELYLLAMAYKSGIGSIKRDRVKAENLLVKSANMSYAKAVETLTFEEKGD